MPKATIWYNAERCRFSRCKNNGNLDGKIWFIFREYSREITTQPQNFGKWQWWLWKTGIFQKRYCGLTLKVTFARRFRIYIKIDCCKPCSKIANILSAQRWDFRFTPFFVPFSHYSNYSIHRTEKWYISNLCSGG